MRRALEHVLDEHLARGRVFCEWGSGLGAVTTLASLLSFDAHGIEIEGDLVDAARRLALDVDAGATFAHGTFLQPGDETLAEGSHLAHGEGGPRADAYRALGVRPAECDVVFHYPWPGEEALTDALFVRHTTPGALLLTFHDFARVLAQRHVEDASELQPVGWI